MGSDNADKHLVCIAARDHLDTEGSVVRSGIALADAVLEALDGQTVVEIDLHEIRGASTSYFNVFLRRIKEGYGLQVLDDRVRMRFASDVQEMVYNRSHESMKRGTRTPTVADDETGGAAPDPPTEGLFQRLVTLFRKSF